MPQIKAAGIAVALAATFAFLTISAHAQTMPPTTDADIPDVPDDPETAPPIRGQNVDGMRVYIRAGLKTHGPGLHDYPQFLADWSKLLTEHGAVVDGSLHFPSDADLEGVDVMLMYKGDSGYLTSAEKSTLDNFVRRGGGIVTIHDVLCGPDPAHFSSIVGGGKKHGETNYSAGPITYEIVDPDHPIMQGVPASLTIQDEAFYAMTWAKDPEIHVLATAEMPESRSAGSHAGEVVPQIWTYEHTVPGGQPARAFVWMQGHLYTNIVEDPVKSMLLRGIAWAGNKPVNELVDYVPPPEPPRRPRNSDR